MNLLNFLLAFFIKQFYLCSRRILYVDSLFSRLLFRQDMSFFLPYSLKYHFWKQFVFHG